MDSERPPEVLGSACPQCERIYAVPAAASAAGVRCDHCGRIWEVPRRGGDGPGTLCCTRHPGRNAASVCDRCEQAWCAACIRARKAGNATVSVTPCCEGHCVPVGRPYDPRPFWNRPAEVLLYPLRTRGLLIFAIVYAGMFVPFVSWVLLLLLSGYLVHVLLTSAEGMDHLPEFPDFVDVWHAIAVPLGLLLCNLGVVMLPAILYARWRGWSGDDPVVWALGLWGLASFPIVAMATGVTRSVAPVLNPVNLLRIIRAIPRTYLMVVLFQAILLLAAALLRPLLESDAVLAAVRVALDLYVLFLVFRILGLAVHQTRGRVDWGV